jgi:putative membrane protein
MNKLAFAAIAALACTAQQGFAAGFLTAQEFVTRASAAGQAEVELGKLAIARSSAPDIRGFAQKMIEDHGRIGQELAMLAKSKGLAVSAAPDDAQRSVLAELRGKSGPAFDEAYAQQAQKDHDEAVSLFSAAGTLQDTVLAEFARRTLPELTEHQQAAAHLSKVR